MGCEDLEVAYMLALGSRLPQKKKRRRVINPQAQRIYDVYQLVEGNRSEPTYSSNLAPLVVRAQTLQKRLNHGMKITLKETSVKASLEIFCANFGIDDISSTYRTFELGKSSRCAFLESLVSKGYLEADEQAASLLVSSIESFSALVTALVAYTYFNSGCSAPPSSMNSLGGWVYLPNFLVKQ